MTVTIFRIDELFARAPAPSPVPVPIGEPVSQVQSISIPSTVATSRCGVWECSPGRWVRQVRQAEFCHFLSGKAVFHPEHGDPIEIGAGDVVSFPANSEGSWTIIEHSRKIFIIFAEAQAK